MDTANQATASKIVNALFTAGTGQKTWRGVRLEIKDAHEYSLGGWCEEAVEAVVLKILNERKP
jgi:hypothetical protein